jgi:hypothetical protein
VSPAPTCQRCRSSADVVRLATGYSWLCRSCWLRVRHLDLAVQTWRLWQEIDWITREARA